MEPRDRSQRHRVKPPSELTHRLARFTDSERQLMTATLSTTTELTGPLPQDLLRRIDAY